MIRIWGDKGNVKRLIQTEYYVSMLIRRFVSLRVDCETEGKDTDRNRGGEGMDIEVW